MTAHFRCLIVLTVVLAATVPARAADGTAFAGIVARAVTEMIRPAYDRLAESAATEQAATQALCAAPSPETLDAARSAFAGIVRDWSAIELIRFGPVRDANRYERLFFWPDRRGLGLRQVQAALAARDPALLEPGALAARSVALQGIGALEYALYGDGAEALSARDPAAYRCRFAAVVAGAIAGNARDLAAAWRAPDGFAQQMLAPGDANSFYRTQAEAVRDLLGAMTQQLEYVRDAKLAPALAGTPATAKPKRAPLWRSNLTLASASAGARSVLTLFAAADFAAALPENALWIGDQLALELGNATAALARPTAPFTEAATAPETHALLTYSLVPLKAAQQLLTTDYAGATGLVLGFNALDGD